jgi:endonuclease NucS-like protein
VKRFNIVISKEDGGVEVYPMKEWLRQHPEHLPSGLDATSSTSHQLRSALRRLGWLVQETPSEVRLIPSGGRAAETTIDAVLGEDVTSDEAETPEASFGLEFQLRDFIAQNLSAIDVKGKKLQLYVDHTGRDGIEFPTAVGSIDILAVDDSAAFYVFELKRARSPDRAIGQLTRYMGWVQQTIGKHRQVNGVIVAKDIGDKLRYAVSVVPNVSLFEYEVEFHLKPAHEIL